MQSLSVPLTGHQVAEEHKEHSRSLPTKGEQTTLQTVKLQQRRGKMVYDQMTAAVIRRLFYSSFKSLFCRGRKDSLQIAVMSWKAQVKMLRTKIILHYI